MTLACAKCHLLPSAPDIVRLQSADPSGLQAFLVADAKPCCVSVQVYMDMLLQPISLNDDLAQKLLQVGVNQNPVT
jgi:hypothetical protein